MDQLNPVDLLIAAVNAARPTLAAIKAADLDLPTPCVEWNLGTLLQHLAGRAILSRRAAQRIPVTVFPETIGDLLGEDPGRALIGLLDHAVAGWQEPESDLSESCITPLGKMPGFGIVTFQAQDIFVHTWDIGRTIGRDVHVDPELARTMLVLHQATITDQRRAAFFAPPIPVSAAAPDIDKLVAFLGRQL